MMSLGVQIRLHFQPFPTLWGHKWPTNSSWKRMKYESGKYVRRWIGRHWSVSYWLGYERIVSMWQVLLLNVMRYCTHRGIVNISYRSLLYCETGCCMIPYFSGILVLPINSILCDDNKHSCISVNDLHVQLRHNYIWVAACGERPLQWRHMMPIVHIATCSVW